MGQRRGKCFHLMTSSCCEMLHLFQFQDVLRGHSWPVLKQNFLSIGLWLFLQHKARIRIEDGSLPIMWKWVTLENTPVVLSILMIFFFFFFFGGGGYAKFMERRERWKVNEINVQVKSYLKVEWRIYASVHEPSLDPRSTKLKRGILVSHCPSVRLRTESFPLSILHNTNCLHFIFTRLINQLEEVCRALNFMTNSKIWTFTISLNWHIWLNFVSM